MRIKIRKKIFTKKFTVKRKKRKKKKKRGLIPIIFVTYAVTTVASVADVPFILVPTVVSTSLFNK